MRIIRNKYLPIGKKFVAINILGILFVKKNVVVDAQLINHERIHSAQMKEILFLPFYLCYITEWLIKIFMYRGDTYKAYRNISFEKEAYDNENNLKYLTQRKFLAQWRK